LGNYKTAEDNERFGLNDDEYANLEEDIEKAVTEGNEKYGCAGQKGEAKNESIVKTITEDILNRYRFITLEENREILVYDNGVYKQGGEVLIEKPQRAYTVTRSRTDT
jgi:hypothetical protein